MEWVKVVEQVGLFHMLCIPHFHRFIINTLCVCQLLGLVYDGWLWLKERIPIIDMLIHPTTKLPYKEADPTKESRGKSGEQVLADKMEAKFSFLRRRIFYLLHSRLHGAFFYPNLNREDYEEKSRK